MSRHYSYGSAALMFNGVCVSSSPTVPFDRIEESMLARPRPPAQPPAPPRTWPVPPPTVRDYPRNRAERRAAARRGRP